MNKHITAFNLISFNNILFLCFILALILLQYSLGLGVLLLDAPEPWQMGFQDSASPGYARIVEFHDYICFFLVVISVGVFWILSLIIYYFRVPSPRSNKFDRNIVLKYWTHGTIIELVWTITPSIILMIIAKPSFALLYLLDEVISPAVTLKVVGHQWFWSFEYSDYETESGDPIEFDSYMIPENDLEAGQLRLLDVDNKVILPEDTHTRIIAQGADVIHDYAVPSLGLKIDAVPGRLNQGSILIERLGVFYGQCSEICGVYHGFMPTVVESVSHIDYLTWLDSAA